MKTRPFVKRLEDSLEGMNRKTAGHIRQAFAYALEDAKRDDLTGLCLRGLFEEKLHPLLLKLNMHYLPFGVIAVDVDNFKTVNDRSTGYRSIDNAHIPYTGHAAGDHLLIDVAGIIQKSLRSGDLVARFGGDEIICALPFADFGDAYQLADRIRNRIQYKTGETASFGVTSSNKDVDLLEMIRQADRALYHAKDSGRNTVCRYTPHLESVNVK